MTSLITLTLEQLRTAIIFCCAARIIPCLVGPPGTGKTTAAVALAKQDGGVPLHEFDPEKHKKWYVVMPLGSYEPTDLLGIPFPTEDGTTAWYTPELLKLASEHAGWLILDEIDRSTPEVQNAVMRDIHNWVLGEVVLNAGTKIVACMNGSTDIHTTPMSEAMSQRLCKLYTKPDVEGWRKYELARHRNDAAVALAMPSMVSECEWAPRDEAGDYQWYGRSASLALSLVRPYRQASDMPHAETAFTACMQGMIGNYRATNAVKPFIIDAELRRIDEDENGVAAYSIAAIEADALQPVAAPASSEKLSALTGCLRRLRQMHDVGGNRKRAKAIDKIVSRLDAEANAALYSDRRASSATYDEYEMWCDLRGYDRLDEGSWNTARATYGSPWITESCIGDDGQVGQTGLSPNFPSLQLWATLRGEVITMTENDLMDAHRSRGTVPDVGLF